MDIVGYIEQKLLALDVPYEYHPQASMFKLLQKETGRLFQYFYTTHRWGVYRPRNYPSKHYHAKSFDDFMERFFLKVDKK